MGFLKATPEIVTSFVFVPSGAKPARATSGEVFSAKP
jgi:hypothetical protein